MEIDMHHGWVHFMSLGKWVLEYKWDNARFEINPGEGAVPRTYDICRIQWKDTTYLQPTRFGDMPQPQQPNTLMIPVPPMSMNVEILRTQDLDVQRMKNVKMLAITMCQKLFTTFTMKPSRSRPLEFSKLHEWGAALGLCVRDRNNLGTLTDFDWMYIEYALIPRTEIGWIPITEFIQSMIDWRNIKPTLVQKVDPKVFKPALMKRLMQFI